MSAAAAAADVGPPSESEPGDGAGRLRTGAASDWWRPVAGTHAPSRARRALRSTARSPSWSSRNADVGRMWMRPTVGTSMRCTMYGPPPSGMVFLGLMRRGRAAFFLGVAAARRPPLS